ncbi:MAG: hypothetical protein F2545_01440 [Actinobacteria bacterium]|uniref:Unannotated protein n=1 Tax=freshwater metagenome TaxID=449393 RepID=A0A6J6CMC6_9ZZZZ|nr:hypothetical protein [Actinomycetota bacterium]
MESFRTDSAHDRLTALRRPTPSNPSVATVISRRLLAVIGGVAFVVVCALAFLLSQRATPQVVPAEVVVSAPPSDVPDTLLDGESYVAIAAEVGTFPPGLSIGDTVRVVVVSNFDTGQPTRSLDDIAMIRDVTPPAEFGNTYVITVRAPLSVAVAIADAQKVHLAVVKEALS